MADPPPPLPPEPVPERAPDVPSGDPSPCENDDGWEAVWDSNVQAFYFCNKFTGVTSWENPRVPPGCKLEHPDPDTQERVQTEVDQVQAVQTDKDKNTSLVDKIDSKMTTFEKYQYFRNLAANPNDQNEASSSDEEEFLASNHSKAMSTYSDPVVVYDVNDPQDPSRLVNAEAQGKSYKALRKQQRVSKDQMVHFKELSRARKLKNRLDWLNDEGCWDPRNVRKNKL